MVFGPNVLYCCIFSFDSMQKFVVEFSEFVFFTYFAYLGEGQVPVIMLQFKIFLPFFLTGGFDFGRINV